MLHNERMKGFCWQTDKKTLVIVESLLRLKSYKIVVTYGYISLYFIATLRLHGLFSFTLEVLYLLFYQQWFYSPSKPCNKWKCLVKLVVACVGAWVKRYAKYNWTSFTCLQTRLKTHTCKLILVGPVLVREGLGRECCTDGSSDMQYTIELVLQGQYPSLCVTLILYALMYLLNRQSYKSWAQLLIVLNV